MTSLKTHILKMLLLGMDYEHSKNQQARYNVLQSAYLNIQAWAPKVS